jgi:hypothetical protein
LNDWFIVARHCGKEVLVRTDVELGIDDGYTRAGVEALLGGAPTRVTIYPISTWEMTVSILSSPISLAHIPYRYRG